MLKIDLPLAEDQPNNFPLFQTLTDTGLLEPVLQDLNVKDLYKLTMTAKKVKGDIEKTNSFKNGFTDLHFNALKDDKVMQAFKVISKHNITELTFNSCPLNKTACENLATVIKTKNLVKLDLSNCAIHPQHMKIIIEALKANTTIKELILDNLCPATSSINNVCYNMLKFFANGFTGSKYNQIVDLILVNNTLTSLSMKDDNIKLEDRYKINQAWAKNKNSKLQALIFSARDNDPIISANV